MPQRNPRRLNESPRTRGGKADGWGHHDEMHVTSDGDGAPETTRRHERLTVIRLLPGNGGVGAKVVVRTAVATQTPGVWAGSETWAQIPGRCPLRGYRPASAREGQGWCPPASHAGSPGHAGSPRAGVPTPVRQRESPCRCPLPCATRGVPVQVSPPLGHTGSLCTGAPRRAVGRRQPPATDKQDLQAGLPQPCSVRVTDGEQASAVVGHGPP